MMHVYTNIKFTDLSGSVLHTTLVKTHYRGKKFFLIFCLKNSVKKYMESARINMKVTLKDMLDGEIDKITFRRIKNKFRTPFIKINLPDKMTNP